MAEVQRMKWDIEQSAKTYRVALEQYKQLGHKEGEAYADWGTGEINRFFGESEAKKGNTKVAQKYFESARKYYQSSLELCQQNDDKRSEAWALLGLAEVSRTQVLRMDGKYQDALTKYNQAYNLVVGKESVETAHALLGIAATKRLLKLADVTDIEQAYADALKIYKDRNMNYCIVYVLIDKALYSLSQFAHKQAQSYLNQAEEICVENDYAYEKSLIDKIRKDQDSSELHTLNFP
ncbi:MAG: tetratricopeptide repeat protein [Pseudomonadota bacterium]